MSFELVEVTQGKELSPTDRAKQVLQFDKLKTELTELVKGSVRIVEITNKAGREEAHAAEMVLKNARTGIRKSGKDARDDAVKFSKSVITVEDELIMITQAEEDRLHALKSAWDDERAAEKAKAEQVERERVARQNELLDNLRNLPLAVVGTSAATIQVQLDTVLAGVLDDKGLDEAAAIKADAIRGVVIKTLEGMLAAALAQEAKAAELAEQQKALDAQRKALAAEKLAADQREAALKAESDALEKQKADKHREEQDALAKQRQKDEAPVPAVIPPAEAAVVEQVQGPLFTVTAVVSLLDASSRAYRLLVLLGKESHPDVQMLRYAIELAAE